MKEHLYKEKKLNPLENSQISFIIVQRSEYVENNHADNENEYYSLEKLNTFEIFHI